MKNGFTLVELLAVVVILGIILAIAIPSIGNMINNNKVKAFEANVKMMLKTGETLITQEGVTHTNLTPAMVGAQGSYSPFTFTFTSGVLRLNVEATSGNFAGCKTTSARSINEVDGNVTC